MCAIRVAVWANVGLTLLNSTLAIACRELLRVRHECRRRCLSVTISTFPVRAVMTPDVNPRSRSLYVE